VHRENGYRLGQWVTVQRHTYRKGALDAGRRSRLESLPGWIWTPIADAWEEGFANLQRFVAREGHSQVSSSCKEDASSSADGSPSNDTLTDEEHSQMSAPIGLSHCPAGSGMHAM
jgi:hypothetical protein